MTFPGNPLDSIPPQGWVVAVLAITAWAPTNYVWQYLTHERTPRDITQPPEDTSWKSPRLFFRSLAVVAVLIGIGIFAFTPQAEQFAKSQWFVPALAGAFGSYAIGTLIPGWRNGSIEPLVRGISESYSRDTQPKRYWASLIWNGVLGIALLIMSAAGTASL